jgi:hypothetical protein
MIADPDDNGPALYEHLPWPGWGLAGVGLIIFATAFLALTYLAILPVHMWIAGIVAAVLIPLGGKLLLRSSRPAFRVYPHGCYIYQQGEWRRYDWQEVTAIWSVADYTFIEVTQCVVQELSCTLRFEDGARLTLERISQELADWVTHTAYGVITPKILAQWDSGDRVDFGRISLSKFGIHLGRWELPWAEVESVRSERNESDVVIRKRGNSIPWKELTGANIPNLVAFWSLVQEALSEERSR